MINPTEEKSKRMRLRKMFVTGIIFLIPIGLSYWLLAFLLTKIQAWSRPLVDRLIFYFFQTEQGVVHDWVLTIISILLVVGFVLLVGALGSFYVGKKVLGVVDKLMLNLPIVRGIYGGAKQIIEAFSFQTGSGAFKTVVLLEYPRKGCWVIGFLTNENAKKSQQIFARDFVAVFVPSTPNPTTGFLLYLHPDELFVLDMSVEDAVKLIVSGGIVLPPTPRATPLTLTEHLKNHKPLRSGSRTIVSPPRR